MSEHSALALASLFEECKYGTLKKLSIVRSSSAIVSIVASVLLVWILFRSRKGIGTTYHRLLLGLSIFYILFSLSEATFGAVVPNELNYAVWNARGNLASCDAFGFMNALGAYSGVLYMCSLNIYYLAKVRFNKSDSYVAKKLEPLLHMVPILYGLIFSILVVAKQGMNANVGGLCSAADFYYPPHCDGYEDGYIPEGFEIPCGRGRSVQIIIYITSSVTLFLVPITIGSSLWIIYRSVLRTEQRNARYGAGALRPNHSQPESAEGGDDGGSGACSIVFAFKHRFGGKASTTSSNNQGSFQLRSVMHRAAAYSVAYFVTWIWVIIYAFLILTEAWPTEFPPPKWAIAYRYVYDFFNPLQGLWTFLIYMQPDIIRRKQSSDGNISWFKAFVDALGSALTGDNDSARRRRNRVSIGAPGSSATPGRTATTVTDDSIKEDIEIGNSGTGNQSRTNDDNKDKLDSGDRSRDSEGAWINNCNSMESTEFFNKLVEE